MLLSWTGVIFLDIGRSQVKCSIVAVWLLEDSSLEESDKIDSPWFVTSGKASCLPKTTIIWQQEFSYTTMGVS